MSIYSIYFSPTGGTKKVMDILTEGSSIDGRVDLSAADADYGAYRFAAGDLCLIGMPSFGGRVPAVALERMKKMKANGAAAVIVIVFGNRAYDDTLLELKNEASACGYKVKAAVAAVAEHSIIRKYAKGRPDAQDEIELKRFSREIMESAKSGKKTGNLVVPGNPEYREYNGVPFKPKANRACIKCGLCAEKCPMEAIPKNAPGTTDNEKCISCMRCVAICPRNARRFNRIALFAVAQAMKKAFAGRKQNELYL